MQGDEVNGTLGCIFEQGCLRAMPEPIDAALLLMQDFAIHTCTCAQCP